MHKKRRHVRTKKEMPEKEHHEKDERAQAAMEYLLTYGWAIILVLVAISALVYFGVLKPSKMLPGRCQFQIGVECVDYIATSSEPLARNLESGGEVHDVSPITFNLVNKLGKNVYITGLKVVGEGEEYMCSYVNLTCTYDTNFLKMYFENSGFSFDKRCISLETFCGKINDDFPGSCPDSARLFVWEAGTRLKAKIEDLVEMLEGIIVSPEYMNFYCLDLPKEGDRLRAQIVITYHEGDPNFTHQAYGELVTTVE